MLENSEIGFHRALDDIQNAVDKANQSLNAMVDDESIILLINGEKAKVSRAIASQYTLVDIHDAEVYRIQYEHLLKYLSNRYSAFIRDGEACVPFELIQDELGEDIKLTQIRNYIKVHMDKDAPKTWQGSFIPVSIVASMLQELVYDA